MRAFREFTFHVAISTQTNYFFRAGALRAGGAGARFFFFLARGALVGADFFSTGSTPVIATSMLRREAVKLETTSETP
jgi:hypothetical protein